MTPVAKDAWMEEPWVHLCVDMQRLFWPGTDWGLDWMPHLGAGVR